MTVIAKELARRPRKYRRNPAGRECHSDRVWQACSELIAIEEERERPSPTMGAESHLQACKMQGLDPVEFFVQVHTALLAVSFLHCKNVATTVQEPNPSESRRYASIARGKQLTRWRTLDIKPMRRVLHHEGRMGESGIKQALHICRGHFKTFTDRKLFGKHTGTSWWEQAVWGSADLGRVAKDYRVGPPGTDGP